MKEQQEFSRGRSRYWERNPQPAAPAPDAADKPRRTRSKRVGAPRRTRSKRVGAPR